MISLNKKIILALALILILATLMRALPLIFQPLEAMVGPDPYFHARLSEQTINEKSLPFYDALSHQGRYYSYAPLFHALFASFSLISGLPVILLVKLIPVLYGAMAVLLVFVFARRIFAQEKEKNFIALFSALSLAIMGLHVMRTVSYARPDGLSLLIIPAIIFLFHYKKFKSAMLLSIAQVLLHPLSTAFLLSFLVIYTVIKKALKKEIALKPLIAIIAVTLIVFLAWLFSLPYDLSQYVSSISLESSEMGALSFLQVFAFLTFSWLFILVAVFKLKEKLFLKAWFGFALLFGIFATRLALHWSIPSALMAGFGLAFLKEKTLPYTKAFYFLVFVLALMALVFHVTDERLFWHESESKAVLWLKENSDINATIASAWDRGHALAYFTQRKVLIDGYFEFAPDLEERNKAWKTMAQSSDCGKILEQAEKFSVDYFFIHKNALESETFKNGLLEARDCEKIAGVYASDQAKIISFTT